MYHGSGLGRLVDSCNLKFLWNTQTELPVLSQQLLVMPIMMSMFRLDNYQRQVNAPDFQVATEWTRRACVLPCVLRGKHVHRRGS